MKKGFLEMWTIWHVGRWTVPMGMQRRKCANNPSTKCLPMGSSQHD